MTSQSPSRCALAPLRKDREHDDPVLVHGAAVPPLTSDVSLHASGTAAAVPQQPSWPALPAPEEAQGTTPASRPGTVRYSVKFVCGTEGDACGCCTPVRHGAYATQISIHNYSQQPVTIRKRFIPVVLAGAPLGREPKIGASRAEDGIELPPHTATMDDCCRITELLFGAPVDALTIGLLEITATRDVSVTAVYTTASAIDVVQVTGQQV